MEDAPGVRFPLPASAGIAKWQGTYNFPGQTLVHITILNMRLKVVGYLLRTPRSTTLLHVTLGAGADSCGLSPKLHTHGDQLAAAPLFRKLMMNGYHVNLASAGRRFKSSTPLKGGSNHSLRPCLRYL